MGAIHRLKKETSGQGLVEYGLILALVSVVAVGTLGGVGDKVTSTFGSADRAMDGSKYTEEEIDTLISDEQYIPVATADELQSIGVGIQPVSLSSSSQGDILFGKGTRWEVKADADLSGKYIQVSNIDLSEIDNFNPIGSQENAFTGTYDGGGYEINNLTIKRAGTNNIGLFGRVFKSTIKNVGLNNVSVEGNDWVAGLVGYTNRSTVEDSYVTGEVNGNNQVGGLVATNAYSSKVLNSYTQMNVTGQLRVGGLVGHNWNKSIIDNSYTSSIVHGGDTDSFGGLVGGNTNWGTIQNTGWDVGKHSGEGVGVNNDGGSIDELTKGYSSAEIDEIIRNLIK